MLSRVIKGCLIIAAGCLGLLLLATVGVFILILSDYQSFGQSLASGFRQIGHSLPPIDPVPYRMQWSPDGEWIAATPADDSGTVLIKSDGSDIRRLDDGVVRPQFSPDSSRIIYHRLLRTERREADPTDARPTQNEIEMSDLNGSSRVRLTHDFDDDTLPSISPDGQRIAFVNRTTWRKRYPNFVTMDTGVYTVLIDGSSRRQVAAGDEFYDYDYDSGRPDLGRPWAIMDIAPAWSPDGRFLAFGSASRPFKYNDPQEAILYVAEADGSGLTRIATPTNPSISEEPFIYPSWSPDSRKLAFIYGARSYRGTPRVSHHDLYLVNPDGSELTQLATFPTTSNAPPFIVGWSPDGGELLLSGNSPSGNIYLINPVTGDNRAISEGGRASWSPTGDRIAKLKYDEFGQEGERYSVATMSPDGSDVHVIAKTKGDYDDPSNWVAANPPPGWFERIRRWLSRSGQADGDADAADR